MEKKDDRFLICASKETVDAEVLAKEKRDSGTSNNEVDDNK